MANNSIKPVTHVLFDMDGLLLNTEVVYEKVFQDVTSKYGKMVTPEVRTKLVGTSEHAACEICVKELNLNVSLEVFVKDFHALSQERLPSADFLPGAEGLVRHLHSNNIPICVASGSCKESVEVKVLRHQEVFKLFNHIVNGSEVKHGKPEPDVFFLAASRFDPKPEPSNCLVFEDSFPGVQAALSAGMQVVMVPGPHIPEEKRAKATLALNSLEDFKPELFGLPPFTS
ncbi:unnamed protein product [Chironomus riparius]|uniref:Pseudouridine-5'-phosphatase n=1 Tax=Chironomus riparius TaxID=315576 RepID=A0A9N9RNK6_9DIPT|nr:unnamed protein product [Chironomus riparius]